MRLRKTRIPGCFEITPYILRDHRGVFVKTFNLDAFSHYGLETFYAEEYYSCSNRRVLRGLHFQNPPHEHTKIVYCAAGEIFDVVVDLRPHSPAYGQFESFVLDDRARNMVYIPPGCAHGFYVFSEYAVVVYKVTTVYCPENDSGIRWDSVDIPWPDKNPVISERDSNLASLADFNNLFNVFKDVKC